MIGFLERASQLLPTAGGQLPASNYDEMVYFSGAALIARGQLPYKDFLLAHPPGVELLYGLLLKLTGLSRGGYEGFVVERWAGLGFGLLTGLSLGWVAARLWAANNNGWAWGPGVAAVWLYLSDARAADIATLETPANFFGVVGLGCGLEALHVHHLKWQRGLWLACGGLITFSMLCKVPGLAVVFSVLVYLLVTRQWRPLGWTVGGVLATFGVVFGPLVSLGVRPGEVVRQMVIFQLLRPAEGRGKEQIGRLSDDLNSSLSLAIAGIVFGLLAVWAFRQRGWSRSEWLLPALWSLPLVAIFSLGKSFHPWYYVQWAAPLALLGAGLFSGALWNGLKISLSRQSGRRLQPAGWALAGLGGLLIVPLWWGQWQSSQRVTYDQVYRPVAGLLKDTEQAGLVFDPGYSFMAGLAPVRLPFDNKFLVDSAGYMVYLNQEIDRRGLFSLASGPTSTVETGFKRDRAQAIVTEGLSRAGWAVIDEKLARPQLTAGSVEFIQTGATLQQTVNYAELYRVRPLAARRPWIYPDGLILTPFGLSTSHNGQANFDPVGPDEVITLNGVDNRSLDLRFVWRVTRTPPDAVKVFVHLVNQQGAIVVQRDVLPLDGQADTRHWLPGDAFEDVHSLPLPSALPVGRYRVEVGLYRADNGENLLADNQASLILGYLIVGKV